MVIEVETKEYQYSKRNEFVYAVLRADIVKDHQVASLRRHHN